MADHAKAPPRFIAGTCSVCGASTYEEAETRCQVTRDCSDEYECKGGAVDEYELGAVLTGGPLHFHNPALTEWEDRQFASQRGRS
ncbi:hypothetical protein [Azospirillum sp. B2RO_4]|uniref:hypothetical protein n=1 Tax=Azospirillum sp. B2RO_4 TaxID=3027796 RepID=UPI003DAA17A1